MNLRSASFAIALWLPAMVVGFFSGVTVAQSTTDPPPLATRAHLDFFESKVRPLLVEHCYECHSVQSGESEGELFLDSGPATLRGGTMGQALVPGKPDKSLIIRAVRYSDRNLQMPPTDKLSDESIQILEQWIQSGAVDPRSEASSAAGTDVASSERIDPADHWAFQVPHRALGADIETISKDDRDVIDSLAGTAANENQIRVAKTAPDETLIRRLAYDLTGLPPSLMEIRRFVESDRVDKFERLVDHYLAAPDFGERMARHWMDLSRYADTVGYALAGRERRLKDSEKYRDWLVDSFASDFPYDQMIRMQLAADRYDPENEKGHLHAMGFLTVGRRFLNRLDTADDRIDVITRGLLGLTVTCARCHDHKFDPIPTADYYSLFGVISSSEEKKDGPSALMLVDRAKPADSPVFVRGQQGNRGPIAPRQYLTALRRPDEPRFTDGSGRVELADRIASADNPLTARVFVNRVWGRLIGHPLVDTPSDFGVRTKPPAVDGLLDELAAEFSEHWSIKRLIRRIVTSRIYRQSSTVHGDAVEMDPDNQWLARANRKRRDFESLRDALLLVSGSLDRSLGGEPVEITLPTPSPRRTLYAKIDRQNLPSLFRTFDFASPDAHAPKRYFTTVPQQALYLLNATQMATLARRGAERARQIAGDDAPETLVKTLFQRILGREPSDQEASFCLEFLRKPARPAAAGFRSEKAWSYGTSPTDEKLRAMDFRRFKVFSQSRWQAAEKFPADGPLGHAFLGNESGHPANELAVVRRWTAPDSGVVKISGLMGHRNQQGDGIRAAIWIGDKLIFSETQKSNNRPFGPMQAKIEKGQTVDLVADPGGSPSFDSFFWTAQISLLTADGKVYESDSKRDFSGPVEDGVPESLDRLSQLAQTLLLSNEFAFVD